jgi:predicted kinase
MKQNPILIILDGPMGTGKTTTSKLLQDKLKGSARVGLDDIKKFCPDIQGKNSLGFEVGQILTDIYLKKGINVITESAFKASHIEILIKIAKKHKAKVFIYELNAPKDILLERVIERTKRFIKEKKYPPKNKKEIRDHFEHNHDFHTQNKYIKSIVLNTHKLNTNKILSKILKDIT